MADQELSLDITQSIAINAPIGDAYNALLRRLGPENITPDGTAMPMVLEPRPGGRWYRDLGDDQGHLWGFVQVIKPPGLIEITGPLFMSYAVAGHVAFRLTEHDDRCEFSLHHRVLGYVLDEHRQGITAGWGSLLETVKTTAEQQ